MRSRMVHSERKLLILSKAKEMFLAASYEEVDLEKIRLQLSLSRGGLYHYFRNKRDLLDSIIQKEVEEIYDSLEKSQGMPIVTLLAQESILLGNDAGVLDSLKSEESLLDYLAYLEQALRDQLMPLLIKRLEKYILPEYNVEHVVEIFLTINTHVNKRGILGDWDSSKSKEFVKTSLAAFNVYLGNPAYMLEILSLFDSE